MLYTLNLKMEQMSFYYRFKRYGFFGILFWVENYRPEIHLVTKVPKHFYANLVYRLPKPGKTISNCAAYRWSDKNHSYTLIRSNNIVLRNLSSYSDCKFLRWCCKNTMACDLNKIEGSLLPT